MSLLDNDNFNGIAKLVCIILGGLLLLAMGLLVGR